MKSYIFVKENAFKHVACEMAVILSQPQFVNPSRAKFFRRNQNIYLHFMSFLHIDVTQVVEILSQVRQRPTYLI